MNKLMIDAINKLYEPSIKISAPITVETTFYKKGNKIIIHLLNNSMNQLYSGTTLLFGDSSTISSASSQFTPASPVREIIPVNDIVIEPNFPVKNSYVANKNVKIRKKDNKIILPILKEYEIIIMEV